MARRSTLDVRTARLLERLARGPATAAEVASDLKISASRLSRLAAECRDDVVVAGRARATRYARRRDVTDVGRRVPIYEIDDRGGSRHAATLHPVRPGGFFVERHAADVEGGFFDDLPWFLHELRPAGFLGRTIAARYTALGFPGDPDLWTADQTTRFLARHGWNMPGAFIVGDEAFRLHVEHAHRPADAVAARDAETRYPALARDILRDADPGSSAAGEQPKFLVTRDPGNVACLVKFSPPVTEPTGRRTADLLVAEHMALEALRAHDHEAPPSRIIEAEDRVFLEVERYDRLPGGGRRGVVSLFALDAEFSGDLASWSRGVRSLGELGRLDPGLAEAVRFRELFGRLIANTDMHTGNLSFFMRGTRVTGLAPAYDMGPALYAPRAGELPVATFSPPRPEPTDGPLWPRVCDAALDFWARCAAARNLSPAFAKIAAGNVRLVEEVRRLGALLPM